MKHAFLEGARELTKAHLSKSYSLTYPTKINPFEQDIKDIEIS